MSYNHLTTEHNNHVATVTLDRPAARNALNYDLLVEIERAILEFREDTTSRVVIFTGAGRHFCAGADLDELQPKADEKIIDRRRRLRMGERVLRALLGMDQITICAWNGGAIGGGGCLATATDFRIGAEDCFLHYPEIDLGFNLMWQSLPRTVRLVGETRALRLAVGAERVTAETLMQWGLLEDIVARDALLQRAHEFATTYVNKPPIAAQMIKRSISAIGSHLDQSLMHMDADQHLLASMTSDHRAAVDAYINKRDPEFTGE